MRRDTIGSPARGQGSNCRLRAIVSGLEHGIVGEFVGDGHTKCTLSVRQSP